MIEYLTTYVYKQPKPAKLRIGGKDAINVTVGYKRLTAKGFVYGIDSLGIETSAKHDLIEF
jgi:hypothetical protein